MVRTQIQLHEIMYQRVKKKARSQNRSMDSLVRLAVGEYMLAKQQPKQKLTIDDFNFIGSGTVDPEYDGPLPLSVYHDEAAWEEDWRD